MKKVLIGLVAAFALTAAACGSDDADTGDMAGQIQEAAAADGEEITDAEAACAAEYLVAVLGESEAESAIEAVGNDDEDAIDDAFEEALSDPSAMEDAMGDLSDECLELMQADVDVEGPEIETEVEIEDPTDEG